MDHPYPPPTTRIGTFYAGGYPPMMPPELIQSRSQSFQSVSMESLGTFTDPDVSIQTMQSSSSTAYQRPRRRRDQQGADYVKHRRTRSGCYTCRQRRVKCDETRPICDRCRKGKRDCTYPGEALSATTETPRAKDKGSPGGSSPPGSDVDIEEREPLSSIPDDDEGEHGDIGPSSAMASGRKQSSASATSQGDIVSSSSERPSLHRRGSRRPQTSRRASAQPGRAGPAQSGLWSALPNDVRFYLKFHKENLFYHHYAFKYDGDDFLKTTFLRTAIRDKNAALLYAIVAYAAYHHALTRSDDKSSVFLSYYNESIKHLQLALEDQPTVATLLTILQLATIEEFMGDWVNLLGHQRAARQLLTTLYTPQTIMQDETSRKIITWYIRFDIFAGIMSGGEVSLDREWFAACSEYYTQQVQERPDDLGAQFEECFSTSRLLATDIALVFAAKAKNAITDEQFAAGVAKLTADLSTFGTRIESTFTDPTCFVTSFENAPVPSPDDIVEFRDPNFLYSGKYSTMNFVLIDFWAIELTFRHQLALAQRQPPPAALAAIALKNCKMFEAIQYCDDGPPGGILGCQAGMAIAALYLPKDPKHAMWCRRKFALVEQSGYIFPSVFRSRMSEQWSIDVSHWWLPDDEGCSTIVRKIREFIEYRATVPRDAWHTGVRDMSGIFGSMHLEDPSSPEEFRGSHTDSDRNFSP